MDFSVLFFVNAVCFGVGLAMDAFSVSMANGLNEPYMPKKRIITIAAVFGVFQTGMPLIGWFCVHTVASLFNSAQRFIPYIALALLAYIGGKMIYDGIKNEKPEETEKLGFAGLLVQGIATSIDALSVGFTISDFNFFEALVYTLIIGLVTFFISFAGVLIGKKFGTKLSGKASILGGVILVLIGLEIFIKGII